jgi:hypothetical protein
MIHRAYKKGELARLYYLKLRGKEYSNKLAYDLLMKDANINIDILAKVISEIYTYQLKNLK